MYVASPRRRILTDILRIISLAEINNMLPEDGC